MAAGGEGHADETERHDPDGALQGDVSHAAADVHEIVHLLELVVHDDDSGSVDGDIAVLADGHADGGGHHGGGVVNAVANIGGLRPMGLCLCLQSAWSQANHHANMSDALWPIPAHRAAKVNPIDVLQHKQLKVGLDPMAFMGCRRIPLPKYENTIDVRSNFQRWPLRNSAITG